MYLYLYKNFGGDFVLEDSANSTNFAKFLDKFGPNTQNNWKKETPPPPCYFMASWLLTGLITLLLSSNSAVYKVPVEFNSWVNCC